MSTNFTSFRSAAQKAAEDTAVVIKTVTDLLEEHAASREAATLAANLANGDIKQTTRIEVPLSPEDETRLAHIMTLASHPKHGKTVLGILRQYMPHLFADEKPEN